MINWKVRLKNKTFWITIIPTIFLLIGQILTLFNIHIDFENMSSQMINIVETIFFILSILGIVIDPTTEGVEDSERAKSYDKPM